MEGTPGAGTLRPGWSVRRRKRNQTAPPAPPRHRGGCHHYCTMGGPFTNTTASSWRRRPVCATAPPLWTRPSESVGTQPRQRRCPCRDGGRDRTPGAAYQGAAMQPREGAGRRLGVIVDQGWRSVRRRHRGIGRLSTIGGYRYSRPSRTLPLSLERRLPGSPGMLQRPAPVSTGCCSS